MTRTALILGAHGKIGRHMTTALAAEGWQIRAYARGTDMAAAAQGCALIVNGLNPPAYHDWARLLPQITAEAIAAGSLLTGVLYAVLKRKDQSAAPAEAVAN